MRILNDYKCLDCGKEQTALIDNNEVPNIKEVELDCSTCSKETTHKKLLSLNKGRYYYMDPQR